MAHAHTLLKQPSLGWHASHLMCPSGNSCGTIAIHLKVPFLPEHTLCSTPGLHTCRLGPNMLFRTIACCEASSWALARSVQDGIRTAEVATSLIRKEKKRKERKTMCPVKTHPIPHKDKRVSKAKAPCIASKTKKDTKKRK
eukprot:1142549-Pelagomonas_calceolata.AAC.2